ncbi:MAG: type II secretion system protein GspL [Motiliproteus sp.]
MSERLLLRLGITADQPVHWLHWDQSQQKVLDQGQLDGLSELRQLTPLAIRIPSYALVSNAAVLTTEVQLPNDSRAAREAIPYQLEEQLCEEIETLHFVTGAALAPGRYPVAVVAKTLMDLWQQGLIQAGIPIQALLVDAQSIATQAGAVQLVELLDQTLIRHADGQSFSIPSTQADAWLTLVENQLGQSVESILETGHLDLNKDKGLATLASCFAPETAIDLLQGGYKLKDPVKQLLRAWKLPALLLGLALLLEGGQLLWQQQQLKQHKQQLEQQISDLFSATLPGSRRVNPKVQLDTALNQLKQRSQGSDFLRLLQQALPAYTSSNGFKIQNMAYQAQTQTITLELQANNHTALESFIAKLSQQNLDAQIQRSRQQGGQVSAQLSIRGEK